MDHKLGSLPECSFEFSATRLVSVYTYYVQGLMLVLVA